jgi:signal transduction histidine kinase
LLLLTLFYRKKNKLQKVINEKEHELFVQERIKLENEQEIERVLGMLEGQAIERDRIAGEIHDGVGGDLAGLN